MKLFMLDTDISSHVIRRRPESLVQHFERHADGICVSVITAAELRFGVEKSKSAKLAELVENYLERLSVLDWTNAVTPTMPASAHISSASANPSSTRIS